MNTNDKVSIGKPDHKRVNDIVSIFDQIAQEANALKWGIDQIFNDFESVPISHLFDFIKSDKPEDLLIQRYAAVKKISIPGISTEKLISEKLIDIPKEAILCLLEYRINMIKLISRMEKLDYSIPLSEFYIESENVFDVNILSLGTRVINDLSVFAESDSEKLVVEKLQNLCNAINDLVELNILPCDERCLKTEFFLTPTLTIDRGNVRPAILSQQIFRAMRLKRFANKSTFRKPTSFSNKQLLS